MLNKIGRVLGNTPLGAFVRRLPGGPMDPYVLFDSKTKLPEFQSTVSAVKSRLGIVPESNILLYHTPGWRYGLVLGQEEFRKMLAQELPAFVFLEQSPGYHWWTGMLYFLITEQIALVSSYAELTKDEERTIGTHCFAVYEFLHNLPYELDPWHPEVRRRPRTNAFCRIAA